MQRILVPVDGSTGSQHAVRFASRLAQDTGATLILCHVYDAPASSMLGLANSSPAEVKAAEARLARESFDAARRDIAQGVRIEELPEMGDPATMVIAAARRKDVDLITIGSRGLSQVRELLIGSVSEKVLHQAHCPVTVVRQGAPAEQSASARL